MGYAICVYCLFLETFMPMLIWKIALITSFVSLSVTSIVIVLIWRSKEKLERLYIMVPMLVLVLGGLLNSLARLRLQASIH